MSPFLRIGLSNYDSGPYLPSQGEVINPYCAVMVKEAVESGKRGLFNMHVSFYKTCALYCVISGVLEAHR